MRLSCLLPFLLLGCGDGALEDVDGCSLPTEVDGWPIVFREKVTGETEHGAVDYECADYAPEPVPVDDWALVCSGWMVVADTTDGGLTWERVYRCAERLR